jgi:o-succinylbenzoate synthase
VTVSPISQVPPVVAWRAPLRTRFRGLDVRDGLLVQGPTGWAEFSPFWEYDDAESAAWLRAAREASHGDWPAPVRSSVPVNVTVPATDPQRAHDIVTASDGCRTAKVKVAQRDADGAVEPVEREIARIEAVRDALGPGGAVRIDANGAWTLDEALRRLPLLDRAAGGLEYVEQPCANVSDLAAVRRATSVLVAADESIRRAEDPFEVLRAEAADVVVLKVAPLGGVRACLDLAERIGLPVVVSSALESSVGLAAGLALAAALPELPFACGLATSQLLVHDVVDEPLVPVGGEIVVRRPVPSAEALARTRADTELAERWSRRLQRVGALLDGVAA